MDLAPVERYIRKGRENGLSDTQIKEKLRIIGYHDDFIDDFFSAMEKHKAHTGLNFLEKIGEIIELAHPGAETKFWIKTFFFTIALFTILSAYMFLTHGDYDLYLANKVFAYLSMILVGLSLSLSGICYFWNFADTRFIYRKYLGVIGFFTTLSHGAISLFLLPDFFPFPAYYFYKSNVFSFFAGIIALILLFAMTLVSNKYAMQKMGGKLWRRFMSIGYLAYALIIIHLGIYKFDEWKNWIVSFNSFPPITLPLVVFGIFVIVIRLALWVDLARKNKKKAAPVAST